MKKLFLATLSLCVVFSLHASLLNRVPPWEKKPEVNTFEEIGETVFRYEKLEMSHRPTGDAPNSLLQFSKVLNSISGLNQNALGENPHRFSLSGATLTWMILHLQTKTVDAAKKARNLGRLLALNGAFETLKRSVLLHRQHTVPREEFYCQGIAKVLKGVHEEILQRPKKKGISQEEEGEMIKILESPCSGREGQLADVAKHLSTVFPSFEKSYCCPGCKGCKNELPKDMQPFCNLCKALTQRMFSSLASEIVNNGRVDAYMQKFEEELTEKTEKRKQELGLNDDRQKNILKMLGSLTEGRKCNRQTQTKRFNQDEGTRVEQEEGFQDPVELQPSFFERWFGSW